MCRNVHLFSRHPVARDHIVGSGEWLRNGMGGIFVSRSHGEIAGNRDKGQEQHRCQAHQAVSQTMAFQPGTQPIPGYR